MQWRRVSAPSLPSRLAIGSNDVLYVTESNNGRVQKFITAGQLGRTIDGGQPSFPVGIDVDSSDNMYAVEVAINPG